MELLVHASTYGHLLVACSLEVVAVDTDTFNVLVIMVTPTAHLLLWAMTIFVRVLLNMLRHLSFIQMLNSGMARFVRVVAHAATSTILHGSPRT